MTELPQVPSNILESYVKLRFSSSLLMIFIQYKSV